MIVGTAPPAGKSLRPSGALHSAGFFAYNTWDTHAVFTESRRDEHPETAVAGRAGPRPLGLRPDPRGRVARRVVLPRRAGGAGAGGQPRAGAEPVADGRR